MEQAKINLNEWADYWRYDIGVNVIPANTREKTTFINWRQFQNNPISTEQHEAWKTEGAFTHGMAIIAGRTWHNHAKKDYHLILVDLDNRKAIEEFCTRNGKEMPLTELAKKVIIEQHPDEPNKAHVIFYATHPLPKKSSDVTRLAYFLEHNEIPALEVKGASEHGILFVSPSPYKNGSNYQIIGTKEPEIFDDMQEHLEHICIKYGMQYENISRNINNTVDNNLIPIKDLFKPGAQVIEGQNRHEALMRVMESLILRNKNILNSEEIKTFAATWNKRTCKPPLDAKEFQKQWKSSVKYVEKICKEKAITRD